jgi:hypothetical protein
MDNELMPNVSRHFLFSILSQDQITGIKIIETIAESKTEDVDEFLTSLKINLEGYFWRLGVGMKNYEKLRLQELKDLKNLHLEENVEDI